MRMLERSIYAVRFRRSDIEAWIESHFRPAKTTTPDSDDRQ